MSTEESLKTKNLTDILARGILTLVRLARDPKQAGLNNALDELQGAVSGEILAEKFEAALQRLKTEILRSDFGSEGAKPEVLVKPEAAVSTPTPDTLATVKAFYQEFLTTLQASLDGVYLKKLGALLNQVAQAQDFQTLLAARPAIEDVIHLYAQQVFEERKKAAAFIADVGRMLSEMEQYLLSSLKHFQKVYHANTEFNSRLQTEIAQTVTSIKDIQQLENLKKLVLSKLKDMSEALKTKQGGDQSRTKEADRELGGFKQKFANLQEELNRVEDENKNLMQKLQYDHLTGANSRMVGEEFITNEINRFQRYRRPFALMIFDIDHFKNINDAHGHNIGDKCLQEAVKRIRAILRQNDMIVRYGGDEFLVFLPEAGLDQGAEVAEKLRKAVELTDFTVRGQKIPVTISAGLTTVRESDRRLDQLISRADQALYQAKKAGRNRTAAL
ncbi:MAG: GGDEF domain-containing protein [Thermodesulfobacteriota bacterium]